MASGDLALHFLNEFLFFMYTQNTWRLGANK